MTNLSTARAAAVALCAWVLIGLTASAQALECPTPQPLSQPGVIKETPAEIAELAPVLTGGDVSAEIPKIASALQKRYPKAQSAELVNYLITAYCPALQKTAGLSDAQKSARMDAFSKAALAYFY